MKLSRYGILMGCAIIMILPLLSFGYSSLLAVLPDKGENFGCATCHLSPGGRGPRNPFGEDWLTIAKPRGNEYVSEIAQRDSDEDGFTNDEEFKAGTNPGDPNSYPKVGVQGKTWGQVKSLLK